MKRDGSLKFRKIKSKEIILEHIIVRSCVAFEAAATYLLCTGIFQLLVATY